MEAATKMVFLDGITNSYISFSQSWVNTQNWQLLQLLFQYTHLYCFINISQDNTFLLLLLKKKSMLWTENIVAPHPPVLPPQSQLKRIRVPTDLSLFAFNISQTILNCIPWHERDELAMYVPWILLSQEKKNPGWKYVEYNFIVMAQYVWGDLRPYVHVPWQGACSH